jgi:phosphate-selective porin OprO/OprP
LALGSLLIGAPRAARAGDDTKELRRLVEAQQQQLQEQARAIQQQSRQLQEQARVLEQQSQQLERLKATLGISTNTREGSSTGETPVKKIVADYLEDRDRKAKEKKEREDRDKAAKAKAEAEEPKEVGQDLALKTSWNNGFRAETADKAFQFHVGGLFDFDVGWYSVPDNVQNHLAPPGLEQGSDFRRARLRTDGTAWEVLEWVFEVDLSRASDLRKPRDQPDTNVNFTSDYLGFRNLPVIGTLRVGHLKETLSFIGATSASSLTIMERPLIFDAIEDDNFYDNGITISRTYWDKRLYSWLGLFQTNTRAGAFGIDVTAKLAFDARFCVMPIYDVDHQHWMNLGIAGTTRANPTDSTSGLPFDQTTVYPLIRTGSSFQVPSLIDTGQYYSKDGTQVISVCYNHAWGPLTLGAQYEGQYTGKAYSGGLPTASGALPPGVRRLGNLYFDGYFVEVLCFLTRGDHRPVDPENPGYARVKPVENFYIFRDPCTGACGHGLGAWEVGLRYDRVNIQDGVVPIVGRGGELDAFTLGLNWYLNPNARVMVNYVYMTGLFGNSGSTVPVKGLTDGAFHALGMRFHFDF